MSNLIRGFPCCPYTEPLKNQAEMILASLFRSEMREIFAFVTSFVIFHSMYSFLTSYLFFFIIWDFAVRFWSFIIDLWTSRLPGTLWAAVTSLLLISKPTYFSALYSFQGILVMGLGDIVEFMLYFLEYCTLRFALARADFDMFSFSVSLLCISFNASLV